MRTALPLPTAKSQTEIADLGWIHLASSIAHDAEGGRSVIVTLSHTSSFPPQALD